MAHSLSEDIHTEFLSVRYVIRLNCGQHATALEAKLSALESECLVAALETWDKLTKSVLQDQE